MAKLRYIFEVDDNGNATLQIGDYNPVKVVGYKATFNQHVEAIDPGDMPPPDMWQRFKRAAEGDFTLSGTLVNETEDAR